MKPLTPPPSGKKLPLENYPLEFPKGEAFSLDPEAFDQALRTQGAVFVHWRAMGCPLGMINKDDTQRVNHVDHENCFNGFLYIRIGEITFHLGGNSDSARNNDGGTIDGSQATVTLPRFYDGSETPVYVSPFDRFTLADPNMLWPHWERFEHNVAGVDRLRWPAVRVPHLFDNRLQQYHEDVDFRVDRGRVIWLKDGRRPGSDPDSEDSMRGRVCGAWYLYPPSWYVDRLAHEGRFVQVQEGNTRHTERMEQQVSITREYVFETRMSDTESSKTEPQDMRRPRDGSFPAE